MFGAGFVLFGMRRIGDRLFTGLWRESGVIVGHGRLSLVSVAKAEGPRDAIVKLDHARSKLAWSGKRLSASPGFLRGLTSPARLLVQGQVHL